MKIPATTKGPRFYVATHYTAQTRRALSSWPTLAAAQESIGRLREQAIQFPHHYLVDLRSITDIIETGPNGHTTHPPHPLSVSWDDPPNPERNTTMKLQSITPEAVKARCETHPFNPTKWENRDEPDLPVSWWIVIDGKGYFHAVLLAVDTDKEGDYIREWSSDYGWCGPRGDIGAPLEVECP